MDELGAGVGGEFRTERDEAGTVPVDDGGEGVDDKEAADAGIAEGGAGGVAESESANDDVEGGVHFREAEVGKGNFDVGEEAGHEEFLTEFDLVDFLIVEHWDLPTTERNGAEGRVGVSEFFECAGHYGLFFGGCSEVECAESGQARLEFPHVPKVRSEDGRYLRSADAIFPN